jgi:hypothetical protein
VDLFQIILALWLLLGLAGMAFALLLLLSVVVGGSRDLIYRWRDRIQESRRSHGLCARCGYDVRFSPTRCPECGCLTTEGSREPGRVGPVRVAHRLRRGPARHGPAL